MSTAVGVETFTDFARMAGVELLVIDSSTTARGFENEIHWNAAYYRLAAGISAMPSPCRSPVSRKTASW
jgi:L-arabinose isomerase